MQMSLERNHRKIGDKNTIEAVLRSRAPPDLAAVSPERTGDAKFLITVGADYYIAHTCL